MITNEQNEQDLEKLYHPENWIMDSSEIVFLKDSYLPIIKVKNLRFCPSRGTGDRTVPNSRPQIIFKGTSFLAPAYVPYYHAVTDVVAQFHYIKKYIPETNIVFCANQIWRESATKKSDDVGNYMLDILERYSDSLVVDTINANLLFEEVVFFPNECLWLGDRPVPYKIQSDLCKYSQIEVIDDHIKWMNNLKSDLNCSSPTTPGKKIYATRTSKTVKAKNDRWNTEYYLKEKQARVYNDEHILEQYFVDKGFEVVDVSNMTLYEQIVKFRDAEIVVGIKGTNIFNAVWMNQHQAVVMLYTTKFWNYEFERYFNHLKLIEVKPQSWHDLTWEDTESKTPVEDLIAEYERLADLNNL